jgi:hypothetical protein
VAFLLELTLLVKVIQKWRSLMLAAMIVTVMFIINGALFIFLSPFL